MQNDSDKYMNSWKNVLLLKSPVEYGEDPYIEHLMREGYIGHCVAVLSFEYSNLQEFSALLQDPMSYGAIIFTSQQAVHATSLALGFIQDESILFQIRNLRCYVVGKATSLAAETIGFSPRGAHCGNAEELTQFILHDMVDSNYKPVLFACGNLRKDVIPVNLVSNGYPVQEAVVYCTIPRKEIHGDIKHCIERKGRPSVIVFFSPSGVQALHEGGPNLDWLELNSIKIIAFGPSTKAELERYGCTVHKTLDKPTPQSLADAVRMQNDR